MNDRFIELTLRNGNKVEVVWSRIESLLTLHNNQGTDVRTYSGDEFTAVEPACQIRAKMQVARES